ncbi:bacteriocin [Haematobacter missouriensis]|uniref:Bacteriocin n=1 Tax=Haematobacter missouriensis TaxID=366616 RepID=A0A212AQ74_9RHOB|nr:family 1 encapsulin nanocompartment shell protein [Haematobacter missouriensis]KFI30232.1 bacteriocin [Haematobacter missouriensis]OWJ70637.1 bacteriocin [Haematobacter missouriensis]OWJ83605.1 bacteriocin [Haematobacter missouriensis]
MDNLHRALAPISDAAWAQIEEEASRTLKRYLGARRVVDVHGPEGFDLSAVGTGHLKAASSIAEGVTCRQREVNPLVELRVPFSLTRSAIDDVGRGSNDSDWQPLKDAARQIALAEDRLVFLGYPEAGIRGILPESDNPAVPLPANVADYPEAVARAVTELRLAGVNGPYAMVLGTAAFTEATGGAEDGYPVLNHLQKLVDVPVVWSQALEGCAVLTTRGGDFDLWLGQDISIGYLSHDAEQVTLYLQESLTFQMQTSEAVVVLPGR